MLRTVEDAGPYKVLDKPGFEAAIGNAERKGNDGLRQRSLQLCQLSGKNNMKKIYETPIMEGVSFVTEKIAIVLSDDHLSGLGDTANERI